MKKRIIAILLSVSVLCFSFGLGNRRASAAVPGLGLIQIIGSLAFQLIGVSTGAYDGAAAAIGVFIESGVDGLTNPYSPFQQKWGAFWNNYGEGWNAICDKIQGWVDNGDVEIVDGQIKLTYDQYLECYRQLVSVAPTPGLNFQSQYPSFFIDMDGMPYEFPISALPTASYLLNVEPGEAYALCYYNDQQMVFSDYYIYLLDIADKRKYDFIFECILNDFRVKYLGGLTSTAYSPVFERTENCFTFQSLSSAYVKNYVRGDTPQTHSTTNCFVFSNGILTYTPISEVDLTDCKFGLVSTSADYGGFLKSLTGYSSIEGAELDDLSGILPTEYNPSLNFPVNPDLTRPLPDQIIVGDVPGVADLPLSDYEANIKTDIDVPSIIASKFPFCIPFDFIRFLGLLCSDPVAPVFRIPISTSPGNLEQWKGNQTVGEYLDPDYPMFEIDEEIVIDLSVIPLVQPICYTCFIIGFIILLLHITPKMIQH